jgi:hypothetical protein
LLWLARNEFLHSSITGIRLWKSPKNSTNHTGHPANFDDYASQALMLFFVELYLSLKYGSTTVNVITLPSPFMTKPTFAINNSYSARFSLPEHTPNATRMQTQASNSTSLMPRLPPTNTPPLYPHLHTNLHLHTYDHHSLHSSQLASSCNLFRMGDVWRPSAAC